MAANAPQTDIHTCYHCGDDCSSEPIVFEEKEFCCEGCKVVYELLEASNMCTYYNLTDQPGISLKNDIPEGRFAYLQNAAVQAELLEFQNDKISKITFHIPQMHCSSCIWLLENLYKLDGGVVESRVNFLKKELQLTYNHKQTTLENVVKLLAHIGYEPTISLADLNAPKQKK
ncbi:MAG: heavy metal translocating P-type ATPase metal-binding domain-containing protein, partial [Hymenobacteraceae bacterium]|nr:heavy metal translocating P-type ATPase metal-binding domain-containing protein [Hymenobacteraceae bacterium]MDX5394814.1 heavy metal translocating P-type ATPase metal-binding domain-containing protein [Hymenobacteraceae bacterium]MDX5510848.1 heavy metal translocating P-type ATPase metal-binding domain-containing protein [Hymenobacteraceae bacterium]